jgi:hypothetical protein
MSDQHGPTPPTIPEPIHRTEAGQTEVDERMADHAQVDRDRRLVADSGPQRIGRLLEELVDAQMRVIDLQTEQTRLLQAILQAVSGQGA